MVALLRFDIFLHLYARLHKRGKDGVLHPERYDKRFAFAFSF